MIFFVKGVVETVKKLNWSPDIIHLHGWFTALFPLYFKTYFKDEPLFPESKIVSSIYAERFDGILSKKIFKKVSFDIQDENKFAPLKKCDFNSLMKVCIDHSDGTIVSEENVNTEIIKAIEESNKPFLNHDQINSEDDYINFYTNNFS